MELYFCDLCQEAVPQADLDTGIATHSGERTVCRACHAAMASAQAADQPASPPGAPRPSGAPTDRATPTPTGRGALGPGLAAVLGVMAILLSLLVAIVLLVRIELVAGEAEQRAVRDGERVERVEERVAGTRAGAVAAGRDAAESVVVQELERLDSVERQLRELRALLAGREPAPRGAEGRDEPEAPSTVREPGLLLPGDAMERVDGLEEQLLFLQARVHDLLTAEARRTEGREPVERLELPEGEVGVLVAQLAHEDPIERVAALYGLALSEDPGVAGHLTPLLADTDPYVRALSARILERLEARSAVQPLIDALADPEVVVREASVGALRHITGRQHGFDPRGSSGDRYLGARRWRDWWAANWKTFLYGADQGE